MTFRIFDRSGSGLASDARVLLVFRKGQYADLMAQVFPSLVQRRTDGTAVIQAKAGDPTLPEFLEAVEVESPRLDLALALTAGAVLLLLALVLRRR